MRRKLPHKYLQLFKKRVHVSHHVITRSSRLLSGASEPNRGSHYDYRLCHCSFRLLPWLPTRLVSGSQYLYSFAKGTAFERTTSLSPPSGTQVPLFSSCLSTKNLGRNLSLSPRSPRAAYFLRTRTITCHWRGDGRRSRSTAEPAPCHEVSSRSGLTSRSSGTAPPFRTCTSCGSRRVGMAERSEVWNHPGRVR